MVSEVKPGERGSCVSPARLHGVEQPGTSDSSTARSRRGMRASLEHRFVGVIESSVWRRMDEIITRALYVRANECADVYRLCHAMSTCVMYA